MFYRSLTSFITHLVQEFARLEGHYTEAQHEPQSLQRLCAGVVGHLSHALHKDFIPQLLSLQPMTDDGLDGDYFLFRLQLSSAVLAQILQEKGKLIREWTPLTKHCANVNATVMHIIPTCIQVRTSHDSP